MRHEKKYREIGRRLIHTLPEFEEIRENEVRIAYLSSEERKEKDHAVINAECHKVAKLYDWCCKYDFFIIVYEPNVVDFTEDQLETLIRHELMHIGIEYPDSGIRYYLVPHDVEDFWPIIQEKGLHWSDTNAKRNPSKQQKESGEGEAI